MIEKIEKKSTPALEPDDVLTVCRLASEGDRRARRQVMELLFDHIHKTASYLTPNRQEAMDIAQTACIEVILSVGDYRGDASLSYWADRITLRTAANLFRKKTRRQRIRECVFSTGPLRHGRRRNGGP